MSRVIGGAPPYLQATQPPTKVKPILSRVGIHLLASNRSDIDLPNAWRVMLVPLDSPLSKGCTFCGSLVSHGCGSSHNLWLHFGADEHPLFCCSPGVHGFDPQPHVKMDPSFYFKWEQDNRLSPGFDTQPFPPARKLEVLTEVARWGFRIHTKQVEPAISLSDV